MIATGVEGALVQAELLVERLAQRGFKRVVYLGSGVFTGLAREAGELFLFELGNDVAHDSSPFIGRV